MTNGPNDQAQPMATTLGDPLLVEDVLLLLFQPRSRTIAGENTLFYVLGGAVVADLALAERIETRPSGRFSSAVHARGGVPPADPLLEPAWTYIAERPRDVQTVLAGFGPHLRGPVLDRLVERGDLDRAATKVLGLFPSTRLSLGGSRRGALLADARAALLGEADPSPRTAAIAALLSASGALPQLHPDIPWNSVVATRGTQFQHGDWGASAAASAVSRTMTAIVTSAVSAATTLPRG